MDSEPTLPTNVFVILRDLIHERLGLYYDDAKRQLLAEKLSTHVTERGFHSFLDYYYLLRYGPGSEAEWPFVIDALSVQETYFWREKAQIEALIERIVPQFAAPTSPQPLSIWCAACATGEEPLTIAMALNEAGWFERLPIRILASDISPAALTKAQRGIYRERSFRALATPLRAKYFRETPAGAEITPEIHRRIAWRQANLTSPEDVSAPASSSVIFCRNVFIYFSLQMIARTVRTFAAHMPRPGYLFVGAAESLLKVTDDFELQDAGESFVYVLR